MIIVLAVLVSIIQCQTTASAGGATTAAPVGTTTAAGETTEECVTIPAGAVPVDDVVSIRLRRKTITEVALNKIFRRYVKPCDTEA